jgi:hypothetical protein
LLGTVLFEIFFFSISYFFYANTLLFISPSLDKRLLITYTNLLSFTDTWTLLIFEILSPSSYLFLKFSNYDKFFVEIFYDCNIAEELGGF